MRSTVFARTLGALVSLGLLLPLGARASSTLLFELVGEAPEDRFGRAVVPMGPVDGDGVPDFLVTASFHDGPAGADAGKAYLFSGATGAVIRTWDGTAAGELFGEFAASGDFDGDGVLDAAVGETAALGAPEIRIFSGATGVLLLTRASAEAFDFDFVGDLTGDGKEEFAHRDTQKVTVILGGTGAVHFEIPAPEPYDNFGYVIEGLGDVSGDGVPDIAVGAPRWPGLDAGLPDWGRVYVYSGAGGALLYAVESFLEPGVHAGGFGNSITRVGDLDADGADDFAVYASTGTVGGGRDIGLVEIVSGATGASIEQIVGDGDTHDWQGYAESYRFGRMLAGGGDVDGDAVGDFLVGNDEYGRLLAWNSTGKAYVYSGASRALVSHFLGTEPMSVLDHRTSQMGHAGAILGDLDGDGRADIALSQLEWLLGSLPGRVLVYSVDPCPDADGDMWVPCEGDCNDADPFFNPLTAERCNGFDDNCNGLVDEDFDRDNYTSCLGDCDELDDRRNIGLAEYVGDGVDNNCNGVIDLCSTPPVENGRSGALAVGLLAIPALFVAGHAIRRRRVR